MFLEVCRLHGNIVISDWQQRYGEFALVTSRDRAHNELRVTVGNRHRGALNDSTVCILDRADNRAGDFLGNRGPGQTKTESKSYKQSAQNVNVMFHGGILVTGFWNVERTVGLLLTVADKNRGKAANSIRPGLTMKTKRTYHFNKQP